MTAEYKVAKGWAIFIYVASPPLIAIFGYLLFSPLFSSDLSHNAYLFLAPISVLMLGLFTVGLLDTKYGKVIIDSNGLHLKSTLTNRSLRFNEIRGYKLEQNYIYVYPKSKELKKLKFSTYMGNIDELTKWLSRKYPDLNQVNIEEEQQEILKSYEYGRNEEERIQKLAKAQRFSTIVNCLGGLCGAWAIFIPEPYEYAILACIGSPIIAAIVVFYFQGLIRVDERNNSAYPSVALGVIFPACALVARALLDYNLLEYINIWQPAGLITIILLFILLLGSKELRFTQARTMLTAASLALFLFGYGYGTVVTINGIYDDSTAQNYTVQVKSKRISSGKSTTYYLNITPWGKQIEADEVSVTKEMYNKVSPGDHIEISSQKGWLNIPWFNVVE